MVDQTPTSNIKNLIAKWTDISMSTAIQKAKDSADAGTQHYARARSTSNAIKLMVRPTTAAGPASPARPTAAPLPRPKKSLQEMLEADKKQLSALTAAEREELDREDQDLVTPAVLTAAATAAAAPATSEPSEAQATAAPVPDLAAAAATETAAAPAQANSAQTPAEEPPASTAAAGGDVEPEDAEGGTKPHTVQIVGGRLVIETEQDVVAVMLDVIHEVFYNPDTGLWPQYDRNFAEKEKAEYSRLLLSIESADPQIRAQSRFYFDKKKNEETSRILNSEFTQEALREIEQTLSGVVPVKHKQIRSSVKNHIRLHLLHLIYGRAERSHNPQTMKQISGGLPPVDHSL
eukprot:TRINITY_DN8117_c0_g1_i6.p1 TRINITY_DN8117_c0_g1~~TRINITY_DN8117_c0_g1_i6.p1  ORF type:complete len:348 (-),score=103.68 TRINITY_DN8117_c0_g1_i6:30-1073(-)